MPKGYLYAVRMLIPDYPFNPIKIGYSTKVEARAINYNCGPFPTEWLGVWPAKNGTLDERTAHKHFAEYRLTGEWFKPEDSLLEFIQASLSKYQELLALTDDESKAFEQFEPFLKAPAGAHRSFDQIPENERAEIKREYFYYGKLVAYVAGLHGTASHVVKRIVS